MKKLISLLFLGFVLQAQLATYGLSVTVTTAGTAVRISSTDLVVRSLAIQAKAANTGVIYVGGSDVLNSSKNGVALTAGSSFGFLPSGESKTSVYYNLKNIWIDSSVNSEGVSVTYIK